MSSCCSSPRTASPAPLGFLRDRLFWLFLAVGVLLAAAPVVPLLLPFRTMFFAYAGKMALPLGAGLLIGGVLGVYVPREYVSRLLSGHRKRSILTAVGSGFLMSMCSHGILALAVQLYRKGAAPSSVVAFLLASPWANFSLTLMLVGFFGPLKAAVIVIAALATAIVTGLLFRILERKGWVERNPDTVDAAGLDIGADLRRRWAGYRFRPGAEAVAVLKATGDLAGMTVFWCLLGATMAAAASAYVPAHFFHQFMGKSLSGLFGTLLGAAVIETCSEGSSPLAFEIYRQTGALGNALVFLLAGVAADYTEIALLWGTAGPRTALWLPAIAVPLIVCWGFLANVLW